MCSEWHLVCVNIISTIRRMLSISHRNEITCIKQKITQSVTRVANFLFPTSINHYAVWRHCSGLDGGGFLYCSPPFLP